MVDLLKDFVPLSHDDNFISYTN